jgi:hypothetical protein
VSLPVSTELGRPEHDEYRWLGYTARRASCSRHACSLFSTGHMSSSAAETLHHNGGYSTTQSSGKNAKVARLHGCRTTAGRQGDCREAGGRATQGAVAEVGQRREQLPR